tara:strand:+ start:8540 stop:9538 length:999 start_codon:yes stop_codon:yes gene_type:complete
MRYLILNNTTAIHSVLASKIAMVLANNGIVNVSLSPKFNNKTAGTITFGKLIAVKSFFNSIVYFLKGFRNIIITAPAVYALPAMLLGRLFNNKVIYFLHEPNLVRNDVYSKMVNLYTYVMVYISTDIIVLSGFALSEAKVKFPSKNIVKINYPSGLSGEVNKISRRYITFIGNLSDNKRVDMFIELAKNSSHEFLIAGSGNYAKYKNDIKSYNIKFINRFLTQNEYDALIQQSFFVVLPYESSTQSAVLFDSYRNGTPVITTGCGSFKEFVIQGETGYVFNIDQFISRSLLVINELNEKNSERLIGNCLHYFTRELSDRHFESKFMNFINQI